MLAHTWSRVATAASSSKLLLWQIKEYVPTNSIKISMTNSLFNICAWIIRPFASVEGVGFENVIQTALNIGFASKTSLLAEDLMKSRQTIKRKIIYHYDKDVIKLYVIVHKHFKNNVRAAFLW